MLPQNGGRRLRGAAAAGTAAAPPEGRDAGPRRPLQRHGSRPASRSPSAPAPYRNRLRGPAPPPPPPAVVSRGARWRRSFPVPGMCSCEAAGAVPRLRARHYPGGRLRVTRLPHSPIPAPHISPCHDNRGYPRGWRGWGRSRGRDRRQRVRMTAAGPLGREGPGLVRAKAFPCP